MSDQTGPAPPSPTESEAEAAERLSHGSSFGAAAAAYAEHRPDYAVAAVRWALEPVRDRPAVLAVAALLVAAAMAAPLVLRARPGAPRVAAAAAWCLALGIGAALLSGDAGAAAEAMLPSCILVPAWAARPWRRPGSRARRRAVIIRGPAA